MVLVVLTIENTDYSEHECSMRKLTLFIIQLSDSDDYEGGDFEFGLTDKEGTDLIKGKSKGCLLVFPSFLSHRVTPITKGTRYSIITWMEGDTFR